MPDVKGAPADGALNAEDEEHAVWFRLELRPVLMGIAASLLGALIVNAVTLQYSIQTGLERSQEQISDLEARIYVVTSDLENLRRNTAAFDPLTDRVTSIQEILREQDMRFTRTNLLFSNLEDLERALIKSHATIDNMSRKLEELERKVEHNTEQIVSLLEEGTGLKVSVLATPEAVSGVSAGARR